MGRNKIFYHILPGASCDLITWARQRQLPWKPGNPSLLKSVFSLAFLCHFPRVSVSAPTGGLTGMRTAAEALELGCWVHAQDQHLPLTGPWGKVGSEKEGRDRTPFIRENWGGKTLLDRSTAQVFWTQERLLYSFQHSRLEQIYLRDYCKT